MHLGKVLKIHLKNGRILFGKLILLDKDVNMCLDDCIEKCDRKSDERCVNPSCDLCMRSIVQWGVVHIFGEDIEGIYLGEE